LSASTKYIVDADKNGVVNVSPVFNSVPPDGALYHFTVAEEEAVIVTVPGPHLETLLTPGEFG
jgi:hypothetical protein